MHFPSAAVAKPQIESTVSAIEKHSPYSPSNSIVINIGILPLFFNLGRCLQPAHIIRATSLTTYTSAPRGGAKEPSISAATSIHSFNDAAGMPPLR